MTDLWPADLGDVTTSKSPVTILKEQASILGTRTKNIVKAYIKRISPDNLQLTRHTVSAKRESYYTDPFHYGFYLQGPALDNYTYRLFDLSFGVDRYPARFMVDDEIANELNANPNEGLVAGNEEEFLQALATVLGSQKTRKVIHAILSQSVDAGTEDQTNSD
jgi:hypothetical protein